MPTQPITQQKILTVEDQYIVCYTIGRTERIYITSIIELVDKNGNRYSRRGKYYAKRITRREHLVTWCIVRDLALKQIFPSR